MKSIKNTSQMFALCTEKWITLQVPKFLSAIRYQQLQYQKLKRN